MYQKCINCQPFYRQKKDWEQLGVKLNRGTMAIWFNTCAQEYLEPVYNKLYEYFLKQSVIHADETTCQVLHEDDKTPESKSYIWLYTSGAFEKHRIVIYEYQPSRERGSCSEIPCGLPRLRSNGRIQRIQPVD